MHSSDSVQMDDDSGLVKEDDLLPGCSTLDEFLEAGYPIIVEGIRCSNNLPQDKQFGYLKTFPEFNEVMKTEGKRIQETMQKLLTYCGVKKQIAEQVPSDKFDVVTDLNDKLLDRLVSNLSELDGTRFNPNEDFGETTKKVSGSWNKNQLLAAAQAKEREDEEIVQLVVQTRTVRPQVFFKDKIDNRNVPWVPKLKDKPNQLKQLTLDMDVNENGEFYKNPYEYELSVWKPQEDWLQEFKSIEKPPSVETTPLVYAETEEQLDGILQDLKKQKVFAIDLEAHSYRSYMGFVCLMQISTGEKDYLIDTLKLRHKLYILNEVFTKPTILKVFHGAFNDIEWLQRDFNLYIVGMFDTFTAAKALDYPKLGLAYLLKKFCNMDSNKKFQLFDWRIRPLPAKAIEYARGDTHYLTYIYKMLSNELLEKGLNKTNLLEAVFMNSCQTCQRVFLKPRLDENSHVSLYMRMKRHFDNRQLYAFKEIYKWRDTIAREEDESTGYVLSNHMMTQICQTLPRELQGILACCNPIPPLVRQHALQLHNIILRAKEQPLVKSVTEIESAPSKSSQFSVSRDVDLEIRLNTYVHDSANVELRDDLPTLLDGNLQDLGEPPATKPKLSLLVNKPPSEIENLADAVIKINFIPPYDRYKKVLPYSIQEEKERLEKEKKEEDDRMQKTTEMQYQTQAINEANSCSPKKREAVREPPKPLIFEDGAVKKRKKSLIINAVDDSGTKIKQDPDEVDPADLTGVCGGSISANPRDNQQTSRGRGDRRNRKPRHRNRGNHNRSFDEAEKPSNDHQRQERIPEPPRNPPQNDGFTPFDYSAVDFNKFHSGSLNQVPGGGNKKGGKKNRQFKGKPNRKRGGSSGARGRW